MPALFIGHGNPMNAVSQNACSKSGAVIGQSIPRPVAVLAISAHWYVSGTAVTGADTPRTIHDFGGFPEALFKLQYPAPGNPTLARRVRERLAPLHVGLDMGWGLDHGTWSVLCHVFPKADIPVVQLSIDADKPTAFHYGLGQRLASLRSEGVLIVGSGNLVHNLGLYAWDGAGDKPFDWAARFERRVRDCVTAGDDASLIAYEKMGRDAAMAIPSPDHYLPLLYVLGARQPSDAVSFPVEGFDGGSLSMLSVQFG